MIVAYTDDGKTPIKGEILIQGINFLLGIGFPLVPKRNIFEKRISLKV